MQAIAFLQNQATCQKGLFSCYNTIMTTLAINKRATFDYELQEHFEAGLMLLGAEVKSIKTGHISLKGSFVHFHEGELYLVNADIPQYKFAKNLPSYDARRSRKILIKKAQIKSLIGKIHAQGLTLVPLKVYTKKRLIKLEFALARGKKSFDKRANIAKKEAGRAIERKLKNGVV